MSAVPAVVPEVLYHYSEDPDITVFVPRVAPTQRDKNSVVWAMDETHSPLYYFPRDCPRVSCWALPTTTDADRERFLGHSGGAWMVAAIEAVWWERVRDTPLYRYHMPGSTFTAHDQECFYGAYISTETVTPLGVEPVGDLIGRLTAENVELRILPSLWPLHDALLSATLHFSMIRMRNAAPRREAKIS